MKVPNLGLWFSEQYSTFIFCRSMPASVENLKYKCINTNERKTFALLYKVAQQICPAILMGL